MRLFGIILVIVGVLWGCWWWLGAQFAEPYKGLDTPFYWLMAAAALPIGLGMWLVLK